MRTCVVFGGSKGIGAAIARLFANDQFNVAILSRSSENVAACVKNICDIGRAQSSQVTGLQCDVRDEAAVVSAVQTINSAMGPISVLINAAGINQDKLLIKSKTEDIRNMLDVNLVGSMTTCKVVLRSMIQQRSGCIINIGSIIGSKGNVGQCAYSASKAGLEGFTKSLAKEVASRGIRVNCINPGFIHTEMTEKIANSENTTRLIPLGRMGEPEEVAHLARFLVDASYITGQDLEQFRAALHEKEISVLPNPIG